MSICLKLLQDTLKALDWGEDPVYVIGHRSPDADSVFSAMAYAALMRELGFDAEARIAGKPNNETRLAAEWFHLTLPEEMSSVEEGRRLILVDHSEYSQAVVGASKARILQIIDHHGVGDIVQNSRMLYKSMPAGSTCTVIYMTCLEADLPISITQAQTMLCGIISDTRDLTKFHTEADRHARAALAKIASQSESDVKALALMMERASRDYFGMDDREIFENDCKTYQIGGRSVVIASLDWDNDKPAEPFLERMYGQMCEYSRKNLSDLAFAKVDDNSKGTFILFTEGEARSIAEDIFGLSENGRWLRINQRVNRKSMLLPEVAARIKGKC